MLFKSFIAKLSDMLPKKKKLSDMVQVFPTFPRNKKIKIFNFFYDFLLNIEFGERTPNHYNPAEIWDISDFLMEVMK